MAQYLPYIPETIPEPALYKPDFNFYDRMLQRKQSLFEQGASRVKSAYSSVLNAPLSNKNNIPLRDQYIKDAQEQLTKLSSSDLSLMENVNAAEQIYAPFWQDKFIVQDAAITKSYQNEMQKLMAWRDSSKPEERERYSAISMMDLQNGLSKLQNADRTPEAFGALEMRKAEPFTNIEAYLQKQAKEQGMDIKYDDPNGPYLIETVNGERSKQKYATWASAMVGNNFQGQFDVTGRVENEERLKVLKRANPNLSDTEAQALIAKDVVSELNQGFTKRHQEIDVEVARIDSLLSSIAQSGGPNNKATFDNLVAQRAELMAKKSAINEEYKGFDQGKDKIIEYVTNAPKQYFSVLAKQRLINNWATGRASVDQKLVKENTAFTSAQNIELRRAEHEATVLKNNRDYEQQVWERAHPNVKTGSKTTTTKDANGNVITTTEDVPGIDETKSIIYSGKSGTVINRTAAEIYDIFSNNQRKRFTDSNNALFSQDGILGLAKNLGISEADVSNISTAFKSEFESNYEHKYTDAQAKASNTLISKLLASPAVKEAGINKITGPGTMRNALMAYSIDYFKNKFDNNIPLTAEEKSIQKNMIFASVNLSKYNALENQRKQLIKDRLLNDNTLKHLVVDDGSGNKDLVSIGDLEKKLKATEFFDEDGNKINISAKDLAKAYISGNVKDYVPTGMAAIGASGSAKGGWVTTGKSIKINGIDYHSSGQTQYNQMTGSIIKKIMPKGLEELESAISGLDNIYGSSQKISKDIVTAHNKVVPNLLEYRNLTGVQSKEFKLNFKSNATMASGDNATLAVYQGTQLGNFTEVYDSNGNPVKADHITAINTLLKNEKNIEDYVSAEYLPDAKNGKTLRITISKVRDDEGKDGKIAGVPISDLENQYNFVLKDNTGTYLDNLYKSPSFQIFQSLLDGEEISSDPMLEASGFKFKITPNQLGKGATPSFATVNLNYKERINDIDRQSGKLNSRLEDKSHNFRVNFVGENAKAPDETLDFLYNSIYNQIDQNNNLENQYKVQLDQMKRNGSVWDPKEALRNAGLQHLIK